MVDVITLQAAIYLPGIIFSIFLVHRPLAPEYENPFLSQRSGHNRSIISMLVEGRFGPRRKHFEGGYSGLLNVVRDWYIEECITGKCLG